METRETGAVKWFHAQKGYGFIERDAGGDESVCFSAISDPEGFRTLEDGERVELTVEQGQKGPAAVGVRRT